MPHDSFRDIRKGEDSSESSEERKSLRNISRHSHISFSRPGVVPGSTREKKTRKRKGVAVWLLVVIVIFFLFFAFSIVFSGAKILAYPKQGDAPISGEFTAKKQAGVGELQYEVMTISREGAKEVAATGETETEIKASGDITIFNSYSEDPQELIATTRFESPDGKIFRIPEGITVPGYTTVNGQKIPGSVTVKVIADQPGQEYNIAPAKFTIPGFKGRPQYESFSAESKAPMSGGFKGMMKTVSDADKEAAYGHIQAELKEALYKDISAKKPDNFVMFEEGVFASFEPLPNEGTTDGKVSVKMKGTLKALIFEKQKISGYLATQVLSGYNGDPIEIEKLEDFTFTILNKEELALNQEADVRFTLEGTAHFVWSFDSDKLINEFVGKSKRDIDVILSQYPGIDKAEVVMRPFWRRSFPDDVQEIKLEMLASPTK